MVIEQIIQEEKPADQGGALQEVGVPEQKKEVKQGFTFIDEDGRKYSTTLKGGKRYFCVVPGCPKWAVARSTKCRKHQEVGGGTEANLGLMPEVRMVRRFIKEFVADRTHNDPKVHVRLNDLEKSVTTLCEKLAAGVTI